MVEAPELFTKRLTLRPLDDGDHGAMAALFADADAMWDLMGIPGRPNDGDGLARYYIERSMWSWRHYRAGLWGLLLRHPDPNQMFFAGYAGFVIEHGEKLDPAESIELGWALAPPHRGKGLALEATKAAMAYAFDVLGSRQVAAITSPDNWPSRHLMERLGMTYEKDVTAYQGRQVYYAIARPDER